MGQKSDLLFRIRKLKPYTLLDVVRDVLTVLVTVVLPDDPSTEDERLDGSPPCRLPVPSEVSPELPPDPFEVPSETTETTAAEGGETADQSIGQELSPPAVPTVDTPEPSAPAAV